MGNKAKPVGLFSRLGLAIALVLTLSACRVEVYDNLSQRDANEMTALLLKAGLGAERTTHKDGTFAVSVEEGDFAEAVTLIERSGLPKPKFASIVDVLSDDRLIASPSEERARLNYALSQELSRTVSEIDGVVSARVHIASPSNDPLARRDSQSSASVAIHHRGQFDTAGFVPRIKILIANAVDGLDYDSVSIALFPTSMATSALSGGSEATTYEFEDPASIAPQSVTPEKVGASSITPAIASILGGGLIVLLLAGQSILSRSRRGRDRASVDQKSNDETLRAKVPLRRRREL